MSVHTHAILSTYRSVNRSENNCLRIYWRNCWYIKFPAHKLQNHLQENSAKSTEVSQKQLYSPKFEIWRFCKSANFYKFLLEKLIRSLFSYFCNYSQLPNMVWSWSISVLLEKWNNLMTLSTRLPVLGVVWKVFWSVSYTLVKRSKWLHHLFIILLRAITCLSFKIMQNVKWIYHWMGFV